jgi:glycosyltransferase involved in cell wall biosynthesis
MKHVLYISYDGMTDPLGQSQVIPYLTGLSTRGHRVTILSCEKLKNHRELKVRTEETLAAQGIEWHWVPYSKRPPVVGTAYDLFRMLHLAVRLVKENPYDIVHCRTVLATLLGYRLKRRFGMKLVFDMRGFWADERVEGDLWQLSNPAYRLLYRFFKRRERQYFREADHVIALTERAREIIKNLNGGVEKPPPVEVIPCCVDLQHFSSANVDEDDVRLQATRLGLHRDDFVLIYLGSLGTRYMLREMLEFFAVVAETKGRARFLFVTKDEHDVIESLSRDLGIAPDRVVVTSGTYDEVPVLIRLADAAVFFIKTGLSGSAVSPTKQAELLGLGVPIVCNAGIGDGDRLIGETGVGIVVEDLTRDGYVTAASDLDRLTDVPKERLRGVAERFFALETGVDSYDRVWKAL